jgi:TPR repeat protein
MMGIMVEQGQGTNPDVSAAFNWYMTSAKQGIIDSYYALSGMAALLLGG